MYAKLLHDQCMFRWDLWQISISNELGKFFYLCMRNWVIQVYYFVLSIYAHTLTILTTKLYIYHGQFKYLSLTILTTKLPSHFDNEIQILIKKVSSSNLLVTCYKTIISWIQSFCILNVRLSIFTCLAF